MPELPVKEVRWSELHLPEIKRDEIVRSLSEVHLPTVELPRIELPTVGLPAGAGQIDWRSIDITGALAGMSAIARAGRPVVRRVRWPLAVGAVIVIAGIATVAVMASRPDVRERAGRTVRDLRTRLETARAGADRSDASDDGGSVPSALDGTLPGGPAVEPVSDTTSLTAAVADAEEAGSPA